MNETDIQNKIQNLPKDLKTEVLDYIEFLLNKYQHKNSNKFNFKFDWEGGLSEIKKKFTSVELQHKASEWR